MSNKSGPCLHSEYAIKAGQDFLDLQHYNITVSCLKLASTANSKHIFTGQKKSEETCEIEILTVACLRLERGGVSIWLTVLFLLLHLQTCLIFIETYFNFS